LHFFIPKFVSNFVSTLLISNAEFFSLQVFRPTEVAAGEYGNVTSACLEDSNLLQYQEWVEYCTEQIIPLLMRKINAHKLKHHDWD
jgi:hypothetical protein